MVNYYSQMERSRHASHADEDLHDSAAFNVTGSSYLPVAEADATMTMDPFEGEEDGRLEETKSQRMSWSDRRLRKSKRSTRGDMRGAGFLIALLALSTYVLRQLWAPKLSFMTKERAPVDMQLISVEAAQEAVLAALSETEALMRNDFFQQYLNTGDGITRAALLTELKDIEAFAFASDMPQELYALALEQMNALKSEFVWRAARAEYVRMKRIVGSSAGRSPASAYKEWFLETAKTMEENAAREVAAVERMVALDTFVDIRRWTDAAKEARDVQRWAATLRSQ
ncbi:hypothetical protein BESB_065070 [Besnoitia besnoiti]|uniref:Transmembrane protein n=1 Tax=Besnoitia besnoiti TaxID=94643 RepID=A0A2A9MEV4_BESBE|nr:hypothetical protein BESB_065070 [Besnoitia besnoiti]PFH34476.1 hypothetical protein BESB_065070 [Besnoitia besnoiti]